MVGINMIKLKDLLNEDIFGSASALIFSWHKAEPYTPATPEGKPLHGNVKNSIEFLGKGFGDDKKKAWKIHFLNNKKNHGYVVVNSIEKILDTNIPFKKMSPEQISNLIKVIPQTIYNMKEKLVGALKKKNLI